jgi:hypothetical protein
MQERYHAEIGDHVRILAKATSNDGGWGATWEPEMDLAIGHIGIITDILPYAIGVRVPDVRCPLSRGYYYYPYYVLEIKR